MKELALILTNLSSKAIRLQQSRLHNCFSTSTKSCLRKSRRISTASASPSESNHHHHDKGDLFNNRRRRKAKHPGLFEVEDISPPRRSLGIHALPPNTHNGDEIAVLGESYVVQNVVFQYRLIKGKYKQDHRRLEVHSTGRFLYNKFLEDVFNMDSAKDYPQPPSPSE